MAQRRGSRYKRYLEDEEINVPRQTVARWGKLLPYDEPATGGTDQLPIDEVSNEHQDILEMEYEYSEAYSEAFSDLDEDALQSDGDDEVEVNAMQNEDEQMIDDDRDPDNGNDPLYPGSLITKAHSASLIMAFALRHSLPKTAVGDLLRLINIHLPQETISPSMYLFNKQFEECKGNIIKFHVYCKECLSYLGLEQELHCAICDKNYSRKTLLNENAYFVYMPIENQVKQLMETPSLSHYFLDEHGNGRDVNITWNCDGMPAFQSGKGSVWPIQCSVNLLPTKFQKEHIMITGLWFGSSKPHFPTFLKTFVAECRELSVNGITWHNQETDIEVNSKLYAIACACDSVARCQLQGIVQYNGYYGCSWCLQEGKRVAKGRGFTNVYPFQYPSPPQRTHQIVQQEAIKLVANREASYGVKAASPLLLLPRFDIVQGFPVDYMHAVCEGVTEKLTNLWFDSSNHAKPRYIGTSIAEIDNRMAQIVTPAEITRLPRSSSERAHWKASEFRAWLLFYSLPVLHGILSNIYLAHLLLLVHSVWVLLQDSVSEADVAFNHIILTKFVMKMEGLYGQEHMSYNVHLLGHLAVTVRRFGPLWKTSCFPFEGFNRKIKSMFHGTRYVPDQICQNFAVYSHLKHKAHYMDGTTPLAVINFLKDLLRGYPCIVNAELVENRVAIMLVGNPVHFEVSDIISELLSEKFDEPIENLNVLKYMQVIVAGKKFCTSQRSGRRCNANVCYDGGVYCILHILAVTLPDDSRKVVFVLKKYRKQQSDLPKDPQTRACAGHISQLSQFRRERISLQLAESKMMKCVMASINGKTYCMELPNTVELD